MERINQGWIQRQLQCTDEEAALYYHAPELIAALKGYYNWATKEAMFRVPHDLTRAALAAIEKAEGKEVCK